MDRTDIVIGVVLVVFLMFGALLIGALIFEETSKKAYGQFLSSCIEDGKKEYECIAMWRT